VRSGSADAVKAREAAAMIATSRWAYRSALARAESRGMHHRSDQPARDPAFDCLFEARGLESVVVERRAIPWTTAS
jgi:succinate dehydrogenase/fumarate reductase flavoprotein subunit